MSAENHKKLVRRLYDEVYNQGKVEVIPQIYAPDFITHPSSVSPEGLHGLSELEAFVNTLRTGLQDLHFTILDELCDGDKVVTRWRMEGTMTGPLFKFAATNRKGSTTGITIHRIANGKIIETWEEADMLNALNQFVGQSE
jgi:predicted ester cyclase